MENKNSLLRLLVIIFVGFLLYVGLGGFADETNQQPSNFTTDVSPNVKVEATQVQVTSFYDGEYGYSVSIPSGNRSTCVWNWEGGNAAIPDSTTTYADTATEKHTVTHYGNNHNYTVNCFDDFGNQYVGVFPTETQTSVTPTVPMPVVEKAVKQEESPVPKPVINTETNSLQTKRDNCTNSLNDFKLKVYEENSKWSSQYIPLTTSNFTIGYSPDLDICIGGYTIQATSGLSGHISIAYTIVDAKTNKTLDIWMNTDNTYDNFITTLSYLTNGQIGGEIEREHTSDMLYCNNAYHRCSVEDKPICPPNNGTFWCQTQ